MAGRKPQGDPRVLFVMNVVLSSLFVWMVLTLAEFGGVTTFSWERFALLTTGLVILTYLVIS
ncbi:hypothetical protein [Natronorarus salvus]|uniref:hypothetical protein n=1 Tax=Natronorarus salvus TaxID=3117733 RepID=UPI002F26BB1B